LAGIALLLAGCGSAETDSAKATADRFVAALVGHDGVTACSLLAARAVRRIESLRPEGCARVLPTLGLPTDRPDTIEVWGDAAEARSAADTLFLRRLADGWRVTGAGCVPHGDAPYQCEADGT
jgi:hypothetical protein